MTDISTMVEPKTDQVNSDHLISGPMTIKITKVSANEGSKEQPLSIFFEGDNGKPYKPCLSMRRVLIALWGNEGQKFIGRSMTIYRDPTVKWGGFEVGGIRISHMSNIDKPITLALTATKANRKPFTVQPLKQQISNNAHNAMVKEHTLELARTAASAGSDVFATWWKSANQDERNDAMTIIEEIKVTRAKADKEQEAKDAESKEFLSDFVP
jgi:hypothetical protein